MRRASREETMMMEIEPRRFVELVVHVKLASEAVLEAARNVTALQPNEDSAGSWRRAIDQLMALNIQLGFMERILTGATTRGAVAPAAVREWRAQK
jgi:hypothetical protein